MQLKRLQRNVGKRAYTKSKNAHEPELTPLQDYIENKLPRCPLYDQLKELRVPIGNYLDFSEIGVDIEKIKMFPLEGTVINNPISKTDHPLARTEGPNENREVDIPPIPKIDLFPFTTLMKQQLLLESHAYEKTYEDFQELLTDVESLGRTAEFAPMTRVMMKWFDGLKMAIDKEIYQLLLEYKAKEDPTQEATDIITFWTIVPTQKLAVIVCHEILAIDYSKPRFLLTDLARKVSDAIRAEYIFCNMSAKEKARLEKYQGKTLSVRKINLLAPKFSSNPIDWSKEIKEVVGMFMLDRKPKILIPTGSRIIELLVESASYVKTVSRMEGDEAYLDCEGGRPFYLEAMEGKKYLVCEDQFLDFIVSQLHISDDRIKHYPMVVPPKPWGTPMDGGYLNKEQTYPLFARSDQMEVIYEALNNLSATPWTLNQRILEVVDMIWYLGGGIVEVPAKFDTPLPPPPGPDASDEEKENYLKLVKKIERTNNDAASLRGAFHLKMDCARAMKNVERFYYPYNMDFRGRVYPIPAHLNHIGSDMGRGLLMFADGKPLGARGFYWLQVHLANLSGQDKLSHAERVNYVRTHLQDFFDAADKPLTGKREWMHKEDPWQYLAACFEFVEALRSPDPEQYICRLPVHQDGTCNGLQHYAALGGDEVGAISVNVLPGSYPQDVYSEVLKLVNMRVTQEANEGNEIAKLLEGKIKRAIVKQTIMTSVYGVTFIGAREQIQNAMKDKNPDFPQERLFEATTYIARKTFEALGEMFNGARKIMAWLNHSANLVTRNGEPLLWITPLGLPVQQPYRKPQRSDEVDTLLQAVVLKYDEELPLNPRRNATAFPPNYVHSLDSTHMMMTALECYSRGIQYASVHDSYWTLPCHVDEMNAILREKFVELYKKPILEQLREFWLQNDPYLELPVLPNTGPGFNLENVKKSPYFFH